MGRKRSKGSPSLEQVLNVPGANEAFNALVNRNADRDKLWELLQIAAQAHELPRSYDHYFVEGMTRHQVDKFPALLSHIASSIEHINENPWLDAKPPLNRLIEDLPTVLRSYATHLSKTMKFGREFLKKNPRHFDFPVIWKRKLVEYVYESTGKPHYSLVANLLNAILSASGTEEWVDAGALRKLFRADPNSTFANGPNDGCFF